MLGENSGLTCHHSLSLSSHPRVTTHGLKFWAFMGTTPAPSWDIIPLHLNSMKPTCFSLDKWLHWPPPVRLVNPLESYLLINCLYLLLIWSNVAHICITGEEKMPIRDGPWLDCNPHPLLPILECPPLWNANLQLFSVKCSQWVWVWGTLWHALEDR